MNMKQVVSKLQAQGHQVTYYVRKDGGILIRSIDGERFPTGASGNARARQIVGLQISEARISQLKYATRARRAPKIEIDDEVKKEYLRVKKKWNKAFKAKGGRPHPAGYFGWSRIKYALKKGGKEEALAIISRAERYASGLAYQKNVEHLSRFILDASIMYGSQELEKLANEIMDNAYRIKEEWIKPAYDELYKLNAGFPPKEIARNIRAILRL